MSLSLQGLHITQRWAASVSRLAKLSANDRRGDHCRSQPGMQISVQVALQLCALEIRHREELAVTRLYQLAQHLDCTEKIMAAHFSSQVAPRKLALVEV